MKNRILIFAVLCLSACGEEPPQKTYCLRSYEPIECNYKNHIDKELFEMCLSKLAEMRGSGGGNYTANDDEDLDHAIRECKNSSSLYYNRIHDCFPNPQYVAQKEFCHKNGHPPSRKEDAL